MSTRGKFGILLYLCVLILEQGCSVEKRPPQLEVKGEKEWYQGSDAEDKYLLERFSRNTTEVIDWPPAEFRRVIDISLDVTGSGFQQQVSFGGRTMPLAEYNLHKLCNYLTDNQVVKPGDHIVTRLFGAKPGGKSIKVDEFSSFDAPLTQIEITSKIFTRRHNDVEIMALYNTKASQSTATIEHVEQWFSRHISAAQNPAEVYQGSPLLSHMSHIIRSREADKPYLFIFVTDGHFDIENVYFSPRTYRAPPASLAKIRELVEKHNLRPFAEVDSYVDVVLLGLDFGGDEEFHRRQTEILEWFLEPQPKEKRLFISY